MTEHHIETALRIALAAHAGETEKNGRPYILHPLRVGLAQRSNAAICVGILHDVVEDSATTLDDLRAAGLAAPIVEAVDAMTRREGESYSAFIERAAKNPIAAEVKRADLLDNMNAARLTRFRESDADRMAKYQKALRRLETLRPAPGAAAET